MGEIIGIDLGTTNSCAAIVDETGQVKLIPYKGGEYTIPSIYAIDDKGNELVGHEAKRQWQLNPKRTVYGAKRLVGQSYNGKLVAKMHEYFAYEMKQGPEDNVMIGLGKADMNLTQVSSKILEKIRTVASEYLGKPVHRAVVTVPAYFNDRQRQAVKDAGKMINLEVVRIINEPTAAALAYGVQRSTQQTIAIYDLGGGTFDISVIEIRGKVFEVKATGGDIFLGGIDWDNTVIDYVLAEFHKLHPEIDLRADPIAMQRIKDLAERTKIDLSARMEAPFNIPFVTMTPDGEPLDIDMVITRDKVNQLTKHLLDRSIEITKQVLDEAKVPVTKLDEILLVGGMTRWPAVQEAVTRFFGRPGAKNVNPDEAVGIGAAIFAHSLETDAVDQRIQLLDVLSRAIGIEDARGNFFKIFDRNSPVPNAKSQLFTTAEDNQGELIMRIYQGESGKARDNQMLGEFTFSGIRAGKAGSVRVDVIFDVNSEGILSMSARDRDTGKEMKTTVRIESSEGGMESRI